MVEEAPVKESKSNPPPSIISYIQQKSPHVNLAGRESASAPGEESSRDSPPAEVGVDTSQDPPPQKWTWAGACIMRVPTAPFWSKLTSPVKPRHSICLVNVNGILR